MKTTFIFKTIRIIIIALLVLSIFSNITLSNAAFDVTGSFTGELSSGTESAGTAVQKVLLLILTAVRVVGMGIAIIILVVIGIKIMIASPGEKANIKQYATNYLLGALILFCATGILSIAQGAIQSAFAK